MICITLFIVGLCYCLQANAELNEEIRKGSDIKW